MTSKDPLDGKIREALADIVADAPLPPAFDELTPKTSPPSRFRLVAAAAAVVVAVAAIGVALAVSDGDESNLATSADREAGEVGDRSDPCLERAEAISESDMDLAVFLHPGASAEQWQRAADDLLGRDEVAQQRFIDQQETFEEFRDLYASRPELVESVTPDILPPRVELELVEGVDPESAASTISGPAIREVFTMAQMAANAHQTCRLSGEAGARSDDALPPPPGQDPEVPSTATTVDVAGGPLASLYDFHGQDCGTVSTGHEWTVPADAAACWLDAWERGAPAFLVVTSPTVEGDPITRAFQVRGPGDFDLIHDSRADAFGTPEVRLFHCRALNDPPEDLQPVYDGPSGCTPREGEVLAGE